MNEVILFKGLFDNDLNSPLFDDLPCKKCGIVPETKQYMAKTIKGVFVKRTDRLSRIDCDASVGTEPPMYETYHNQCWYEEVLND